MVRKRDPECFTHRVEIKGSSLSAEYFKEGLMQRKANVRNFYGNIGTWNESTNSMTFMMTPEIGEVFTFEFFPIFDDLKSPVHYCPNQSSEDAPARTGQTIEMIFREFGKPRYIHGSWCGHGLYSSNRSVLVLKWAARGNDKFPWMCMGAIQMNIRNRIQMNEIALPPRSLLLRAMKPQKTFEIKYL